MLAIRLQRTGRKGLAHYRVIVQEAQKSPKSGRVVARIGHYNPHTKEVVVDKEQAEKFMKNGAQPSDKVARLFKAEKVKLPSWVKLDSNKKRSVKNIEKLRKNQPANEEVKDEKPAEQPVAENSAEDTSSDTPAGAADKVDDGAKTEESKVENEEEKQANKVEVPAEPEAPKGEPTEETTEVAEDKTSEDKKPDQKVKEAKA